ncbi:MAG: hypothetical protein V1708_05055 [Candidatus Micrarchaeota archaeon]
MAKPETGNNGGVGKNAVSVNIPALVLLFVAAWFALRTALRGELGAYSEPMLAVFFLAMLALWWRKRELEKTS